MKNTFIYTLAVMAGLLSCTALKAQYSHEISLYGGGGLSALKYDVGAGEQKNGFGGTAGLGYTFFFSPEWGLGSGAELSFYNAEFKLADFDMRYAATDIDGTPFEFRSKVGNYSETQNALFLQIPLMLQFQTGSAHQFYASAGGKVGIPINAKYKSKGATIRNSGYYAAEDYEYTTQEFMGFGTFTGRDTDGDIKFKTAFFASAEAGMKWKLKAGLSLYTGAYIDYGLNNIRKGDNNARFIDYKTADPRNFTVNSAMTSQNFADKVSPVAAGVKVRLAFGL